MSAANSKGPRLFVGIFPAGIRYADRHHEKGGDYAPLAFLPFDTLELQIEKTCPPALREEITKDAATIQAKAGQTFRISSCNQTVLLGSKLQSA